MTIDLTKIPPASRKELIEAGRRFSSEETLAQAEQTLKALAVHGPKLIEHGFGTEDETELKDARDELIDAGVGRETKRTSKRTAYVAQADAMRGAQQGRLRARSVLGNAQRLLMRTDGPEAESAVRTIDTLLKHTSVTGDDPERMASQLDLLKAGLTNDAVEKVVEKRGGPKAVEELEMHAEALRVASEATAGPRGTPVHTEQLDLIDGIILSLTRAAREAAEVASKTLGEPSLVAEFELSKLYPNARKPAAKTGAPATKKEKAAKAAKTDAKAEETDAPDAKTDTPAAKADAPDAKVDAKTAKAAKANAKAVKADTMPDAPPASGPPTSRAPVSAAHASA